MPPSPWFLPRTPEFHEVTAADLALEVFRKLFTAPIYRMAVSPDGRTMRVRINSEALTERLAISAWGIIAANNLPLTVKTEIMRMGDLVFSSSLVIEYIGELPECY